MTHSTILLGKSVRLILLTMLLVFSHNLLKSQTVWEVIQTSPDHETLEAAIEAAELDGTLSGTGPFTVFAPTDDAFDALPEGLVADLLADPSGDLTDILLYHVVAATAMAADISNGDVIETVLGKNIVISVDGDGNVFVNNAQVIVTDLEADNGVVHVIDAVLIPRTTIADIIIGSDAHTTLAAAVAAANLTVTLSNDGPFTVFAPTDNAFDALPEGLVADLLADPSGDLTDILLYHVVGATAMAADISNGDVIETVLGKNIVISVDGDGNVFVNNAQVTVTDLEADNGVVHVIDAVLIPRTTLADIIIGSDAHTTLAAAVAAANLTVTLSNDGPFTVFAPTDDAFDALPEGLVADLLADPSGDLTDILLYHVVGATAMAADISNGDVIETVLGKNIVISVDGDGNVFVNNAQVTVTDLEGDNGVVHVIDAVLIPRTTVADIIIGSDAHTTLAAAVAASNLTVTLSNDGPFTVFAPTDDAFDALPEGLVADLLADPSGDLTDILLYHVVAATAMAADISNGDVIETVLGKNIVISVDGDGNVFVNNAQVTVTDLEADNGVVHVIDAVLTPRTTVADIIIGSDAHTTLAAAVAAANLTVTLSNDGPFTVFAPTDDAFDALPEGLVADLLADPSGDLTDILLYHVVGAQALSTDLADGDTFTTLLGKDITVTINSEGEVFINDAQVVIADLMADNGVVHVIDAVLTPPVITVVDIILGSEVHTTLAAAVAAAGLVDALSAEGPFTVFAPTDDAFDALPEGLVADLLADPSGDLTDILLYHVVAATAMAADISNGDVIETVLGKNIVISVDGDGNVFVNNAQVTVTDLEADNGVVHVIDAVLIPRTTVADIIIGSDDHTTLAAAVAAANLTVTLSNDGPFTVFAPTDDAFDALPEGLVADLLADPSGDLSDILLYHVVAATAMAADISNGDVIETVLGKNIVISVDGDGKVFVNNAQVMVTDLEADNGVVHVIDAVLIPRTTVADIIIGSDAHTTLAAAVAAANLTVTLSNDGPFTVFAPTNDAFDALPTGLLDALLNDPTGDLTDILLYHVVGAQALSTDLADGDTFTTLLGKDITVTISAEGEVFINDAQVVIADLMADNGVVHVIDAVLTPPVITVVDIILGSEVHTTLAAAVAAAGLVDALSAEGPFTVFAPTNDAFDALPAGLLDALLDDPTGDLTDILLYHVVGAQALSTDLADGDTFTTLLGKDITVTINAEGEVFINDAQVVIADLMADNGVVHVINAVLVPDTSTNTDNIIADFTNFNLYPNPVRDRLNISMELQSANAVTIEIFNLLGSRVYSREMGTRSGSFVESLNIGEFPRGMYIINITTGNETKSRKINIVK